MQQLEAITDEVQYLMHLGEGKWNMQSLTLVNLTVCICMHLDTVCIPRTD